MEKTGVAAYPKKARATRLTLIFADESGFSLVPAVRRTWSRRGQTPVLRHTSSWPKLSAISGVSENGKLYLRLHRGTIGGPQLLDFLRSLLRHIRGRIIVLLDNLSTHKSSSLRAWLALHQRMTVDYFPAYAPELNPDEGVWQYLKAAPLGNYCPRDLPELMSKILREKRNLQRKPQVIRGFYTRTRLHTL